MGVHYLRHCRLHGAGCIRAVVTVSRPTNAFTFSHSSLPPPAGRATPPSPPASRAAPPFLHPLLPQALLFAPVADQGRNLRRQGRACRSPPHRRSRARHAEKGRPSSTLATMTDLCELDPKSLLSAEPIPENFLFIYRHKPSNFTLSLDFSVWVRLGTFYLCSRFRSPVCGRTEAAPAPMTER